MNPKVPTEAQEGEMLVAYLRLKGYLFTHIANESGSGRQDAMIRGARMKRQGVSRGFPDYLVITKKGLAAIELKRLKGSKTSIEQLAWAEALNNAGVPTGICKGAPEAIEFILSVEGGKWLS